MNSIKHKGYTLNLCTDIIEWAKTFYGMPEDSELDNREELEKECMGFSSLDDKEIWIFVPKNCKAEEFESTIAHEVGHIIEFKHPTNPEQIEENDELHEQKAEHYEQYYMLVRELVRISNKELLRMRNKCSTLFPRKDFNDSSGCLKEEAHNDFHVCKTDTGKLIAWEDDYKCDCGCWDDDDGEVCIIYWEVDSIN